MAITDNKVRLLCKTRMREVREYVGEEEYKKAIMSAFELGCMVGMVKDENVEIELLEKYTKHLEGMKV